MTILDILKQEFEDWATAGNKPQTPDNMLVFLNARGALRSRSEMPIMVFGNKPYHLSICLETDGDFRCSCPGLIYDDGCQEYMLIKSWEDGETAKKEALDILCELQKTISSHKDYVQEYLDEKFEKIVNDVRTSGFTYTQLGGNYEGSLIVFGEMDCV